VISLWCTVLPFYPDPTLASAQEIIRLHTTHLDPSIAAQNEHLKLAQTPGGCRAIYNGRPTNLTGPSLSIYHPIFQEFLQEYNSPINLNEITPLDYDLANQLISSSVQYFNEEDDRLLAIEPCLQEYLGQIRGMKYSTGRNWTLDGYAPVECGLYRQGEPGYRWMTKLILEVNNGIGLGGADPVEQAQQDYVLVCTSPNGADFGALQTKMLELTLFI
jgi:hypothetical protein